MSEIASLFEHAMGRSQARLADEIAASFSLPGANLEAHERRCPVCISNAKHAEKKARLDALFEKILDR